MIFTVSTLTIGLTCEFSISSFNVFFSRMFLPKGILCYVMNMFFESNLKYHYISVLTLKLASVIIKAGM